MIATGNDNNITLKLGTETVSEAYLGTELVYPNSAPPTPSVIETIYNVTSTATETKLLPVSSLPLFSSMSIDGVQQSNIEEDYLFSTTGDHTVTYTLIDGTTLSDTMFFNCSQLKSVVIPNSVTSIGVQVFQDCTSLESVFIPNGVTSVGSYAFNNCSRIRTVGEKGSNSSIEIPYTLRTIGSYVFQGCSGITSVNLPNIFISYGSQCFYNCITLASVNIRTTSIPTNCFYGCYNLASINVAGVQTIGTNAFRNCSTLTDVEFKDGLTSVGDSAFYGCSGLTSVTLPQTVTSIQMGAFYNTNQSFELICKATTPPTLTAHILDAQNGGIFVPSESVSSYQSANIWSTYATGIFPIVYYIEAVFNVTSTSTATELISSWSGVEAFNNMIIDGVVQPSVVSSYTFSTTGQHTVKYEVKNNTIYETAFCELTNLVSVVIPENVRTIEQYAFNGSSNLTSITVLAEYPIPSLTGEADEPGSTFGETNDCPIYVPADFIYNYLSELSDWWNYNSRIRAIS